MTQCPCGSGKSFQTCCNPYLKGEKVAETIEKLVRSRYVAYVYCDFDYIEKTMRMGDSSIYDRKTAESFSKDIKWLKLSILKTEEKEIHGSAEFIFSYQHHGQTSSSREVSQFEKIDGRWVYLGGQLTFAQNS